MPFIFRLLRSNGYGVIVISRNLSAALIFAITATFSGNSANSEPVTIAALGDSLVQGYGLANGDGFVPQLQNWLSDQGAEVVLINAGVSGDTTAGGLSRIDWTLSDEVDALIVSLGGNDVLRGIDPAASRANLTGILATAAKKSVPVLLVGISPPDNYGPAYKEAFGTIYPDLAAGFGTLYYPDFLSALTDMADKSLALQTYFQADAVHPNASGVALIVQDIGPSVAALTERARRGE